MGFLVGTTSNPPVAQRAGGTLDWMHILFVGGCWNHDVRKFFKCIRASLKIRFSQVAEYMEGWKLPACLHNTVNVKNIFSDTREDAMDRATGIKGSASEFLSVYAILRRFIEVIVVGAFPGKSDGPSAVVIALCDVIESIQLAKRGLCKSVEPGAALITAAVEAYRDLVSNLWGLARLIPKFHMLFHIAEQFLRDMAIYDTFCLERKHKLTKGYATITTNRTTFEKSVTTRGVLEQRRNLLSIGYAARMVGATSDSSRGPVGAGPAVEGKQLSWCGIVFSVGDVVVSGPAFFIIESCMQYSTNFGILYKEADVIGKPSPSCTTVRTRHHDLCFMPLTGIPPMLASAWCVHDNGSYSVLRPRRT